ncbi:MAG: MetQ/NlpA family ABC transporter substrate-binding protein [Pseudoflavonifractor sp.]
MKKITALLLVAVLSLSLLSGCGKKSATIKVGASPAPHAEILEIAKELLAKDNITLEIVEFNDYVLPNTSLEDGSLDANYFQHITYLNDFNEKNGTHLVSVADIHYEPFAIYPGKAATLADLKDGDQIAVPNDGTNEARALMLLEANGLITLKADAGLSATKDDIAENPHNFDIVELEASQLPARRADVGVAVINGNYALGAGLTSKEALAFEDAAASAGPYVNVLAVKEGSENSDATKALVKALTSQEVKDFMTEKYGEAVVPAF